MDRGLGRGQRIVQHGGNTTGFSAYIGFDPEKRVGLVWLTNTYVFANGTPRAVAAGDEWQRIGIEWTGGYWVLLGGLGLIAILTLGAEVRRSSKHFEGR